MNEKIKKAAEKYRSRLPATKEIYKGLIKHTCTFDDGTTKVYDLYSDVPDDVDGIYFDHEKHPYDFHKISAKYLAETILQFVKDNNLSDARIEIEHNCDGYFRDAYLVGEVPRTQEDIEKDVGAFVQQELAKEQKKQDRVKAKEQNKRDKELALLEELKKKYKD